MMSPALLDACRANAKLSTGPQTAAGKQTSSQNAVKHGLSGRVHAALSGEIDAFDRYCAVLRQALAPAGAIEEALAQDIAADRWRLQRARAIENALFAQIEAPADAPDNRPLEPAAAQALAWLNPATGLQRIALYAGRIQRAMEKNSARLQALQAERKAAHAAATQEAILLTQLAQSKGQPYDSAPDFTLHSHPGFVYSAPEIARLIARAHRLEEAGNHRAALAAPVQQAAA
jgi:hypothetical protein